MDVKDVARNGRNTSFPLEKCIFVIASYRSLISLTPLTYMDSCTTYNSISLFRLIRKHFAPRKKDLTKMIREKILSLSLSLCARNKNLKDRNRAIEESMESSQERYVESYHHGEPLGSGNTSRKLSHVDFSWPRVGNRLKKKERKRKRRRAKVGTGNWKPRRYTCGSLS